MNQKAGLLACGLTLSALLFTGCGNNDDNNVTTKNTGRERIITHNVNDANGRYTARSNGNGYHGTGTTTRGNLENDTTGTARNLGEATRDAGRGLLNTARGVGDNLGNAARDLTGMSNRNNNIGSTRLNQAGRDFRQSGRDLGQAGRDVGQAGRDLGRGAVNTTRDVGTNLGRAARDLTGLNSYDYRHGNFNGNTTGTGMTGTGTTGTGTTGNRFGTMSTGLGSTTGLNGVGNRNTTTTNDVDRDRLVLGGLVIYAKGKTPGDRVPNTSSADGQMIMMVTDSKSIDAIHRVNDSLHGTNTKAKASKIATDIRYILSHAKPAGTAGTR